MFTEQSLRQYPAIVKAFTGISSEAFWEMMAVIEQQSEVYEQERHSRAERERTEGGDGLLPSPWSFGWR